MKSNVTRRDFLRLTGISMVALACGGIGLRQLLNTAEPNLQRYSETRRLLGTYLTIDLIGLVDFGARELVKDTFIKIERLSSILNCHDSESELSNLNQSGKLIRASDELIQLLQRARYYSELTNGTFDVTVKPLVDLYRSHFRFYSSPPDMETVQKVRELVDYRLINIEGKDLYLEKAGMAVTLDGIAKGYIIDHATAWLKSRGVDKVLVEAGGDLSASGTREDDCPWQVGIRHPRALTGYCDRLEIANQSIATSGDYEAAFTSDYRYHHIIDPRSGVSPEVLCSATVVAKDTTCADALSTAAMAMRPADSLELLEQLPGVEALLINKELQRWTTSGFSEESSQPLLC